MGNFLGVAKAVKGNAAGEDCWVEIYGCQSEGFAERRTSGWDGRRWKMERKNKMKKE
jgi:hypothetical protein